MRRNAGEQRKRQVSINHDLSETSGLLREKDGREHQQRDEDIRRHRPDDVSRDEKLPEVKVFH